MRIKGIGNIKKAEAMKILTREGREAVKSGEITTKELGDMYKLEQVKKLAQCGKFTETFSANFKRIPEDVFDALTPEQIASLVDAFRQCYNDGKNEK